MQAVVFSRAFGHGTGVLCAYGYVWPGVRARKWCVHPQKGGDLRTKSSVSRFYPQKGSDLRTKSSGSRFYPQKEGILRTMFVGQGAHP